MKYNTKEKLLELFINNIMNESRKYNEIFYRWSNTPYIKNFINKYYSDFNSVLKYVKIWLDLVLQTTEFYLEYAHEYITSNSFKFVDNARNEASKAIIVAYKKWLDNILNNSKNLKSNYMYIEGFKKYIDNNIIDIIYKDEKLKEEMEVLSWCIEIINSNINIVITDFNILYEFSKNNNSKDNIDKLITNLHSAFFEELKKLFEESYNQPRTQLEKVNNSVAEDSYNDIISHYIKAEEAIDNSLYQ